MDLSLKLSQRQVLSQKMRQSIEILQMNTLELSAYVRDLTEENPLLEYSDETLNPPSEEAEKQNELLRKLEWLEESDEQNRSLYRMERDNEKESLQEPIPAEQSQSLREYLLFQINTLKAEEKEKKVLRFLAQSLDERGYLESSLFAEAQKRFSISENETERLLDIFRSLDPPGVGAVSLKECLCLQLKRKGADNTALLIVENHLEDLGKNRLSHISKQLKIPLDEVISACKKILTCEPKPSSGFSDDNPVEYIIPDMLVEKAGDELFVYLNSNTSPRLYINKSYLRALRENNSSEMKKYVDAKLRQAQWALQCISKRESTILRTAECIANRQNDFFISKHGELKPMRMADIAEELQMHESTVSRAVRDKYLQCDRGIFPLSFFFSTALSQTAGDKNISAESIKERLKAIIEREDKSAPLSDRELAEKLAEEEIQISRRTVAKYRDAMNIPGAALRRRYDE